jgi:hypothetical protein
MADVAITGGVPEHIISDNGSEMVAKFVRNRCCKVRSEHALHRAWQSVGEPNIASVLQWKASRRVPDGGIFEGSHRRHRANAHMRQKSSPWIAGRQCNSLILLVENIRQIAIAMVC